MSFRLAQISDTHLGHERDFFAPGFLRVVDHLNASKPDLVVNSGDMSLDGAASALDLESARRLHERIAAPVRFLAGNHDVGEGTDAPVPPGHPLISEERRTRYRQHFGADFWCEDVPGWRILAINAQLLGSTLAAADEQLRFVAQGAATADKRALMLLVHRPLFHLSPDEADVGGRFVNPAARRGLIAAFGGERPRLVASGHVHQYFETWWGDVHCVWAPSTAFVLPDSKQPLYGRKQAGYVEHELRPDGSHASRYVAVDGLPTLDILDFPGAYPQYMSAPPAGKPKPAP